MSADYCKLCKQESMPYQFIQEFDGHICMDCYYDSADIRQIIAKLLVRIEELEKKHPSCDG